MAALDPNQFCCPICLDQLKDPVTTACGHSYCMSCIKSCWDQEDRRGVYRCPQCRQSFTPRPVLRRNTILAELVEKLKETPADHYAGPGDVECDFCTGRKRKAVNSCLVCLASYCETHLQPHYESPAFKKHKLTDASGHLQDKVCSQRDKPLEVYCRTDQQCICDLCMTYEHRGHDTVSAAARREEIQLQLGVRQRKWQQMIQEREKELQELRKVVNSVTISVQEAEEHSERVLTEMIHLIESRRSVVKGLIRDQEKAVLNQVNGLQEQVEGEITELKRRCTEFEGLLQIVDPIHFLQTASAPLGFPTSPRMHLIVDMRSAVSELKGTLEDVLQEVDDLQVATPRSLKKIINLLEPTLTTRTAFACQLTLDPDTAHRDLRLEKMEVEFCGQPQPYPDSPHRFKWHCQVLCKEGLSGWGYWEVERSMDCEVQLAVSYRGIGRSDWGTDCCFGYNEYSWSLACTPSSYSFRHDKANTNVSGPLTPRIGVYLNHKAGTLSFYSISDTMTLLHRVQTTFTEPLYPGFALPWFWSKLKICNIGNGSNKKK
nr:tripartite motif-containing protein 16-like [Paramormyrops kingsleyae]